MVSGVGSGRYIGRTLANVNFDRFALTVPQENNIMHNITSNGCCSSKYIVAHI